MATRPVILTLRLQVWSLINPPDADTNVRSVQDYGLSHQAQVFITSMSADIENIVILFYFREGFFNPDMLTHPKMMDEILRGLVSTPMEFMDQFMSGEVTNHLFEEKNIPKSGLDLAALNIQRGRDHGLKSYNEYRVACNLKRAHNFDDMAGEINQVWIDNK